MRSYTFIKTTEQLVEMDMQNCFVRYSVFEELEKTGRVHVKLTQSLDTWMVGKPVIASFLGVSEKTLKRWFVKYPEMPVQREKYRCYALTNNLIIWLIQKRLERIDAKNKNIVEKAICIDGANRLRVSLEHYMEHYIYQSQCREEPNNKRLRAKKCYKKSVDRIVNLAAFRASIISRNEKNR